jgi:hypothetical protein
MATRPHDTRQLRVCSTASNATRALYGLRIVVPEQEHRCCPSELLACKRQKERHQVIQLLPHNLTIHDLETQRGAYPLGAAG